MGREPYEGSERDQTIIQAIRDGNDDRALSVLYKELFPKIKNLILKNNGTIEEVQDIFQDAVIVFYKYVKQGKYTKGADIDGFIYGVSKNLFHKQIHKNRRQEPLDYKNEGASEEDTTLDHIITREKEQMVHSLMEQLGERCKELLTLSVFNKLSMKEICNKMGFTNENAAKTSNYKCKQRLMKMVQKNPSLIELFKK